MTRPVLKYKKIPKEVIFEPYEDGKIIIVPEDRHKLSGEQIRIAKLRWSKRTCCMICASKFKSDRDRCIDHCHVTGVIRGQICFSCNTALGHFKDSVAVLRSAVGYLESFKYNPDLVDQDLWS